MHKLLVVDDERDVCDFVKNFFEERGYKVLTAPNGKEAVSMAEKETPDTILMDIRMPKMDGITALENIKKRKPKCRVIMVTCVDDLDKMGRASELGADGYITKPFVLAVLVKAVT